MYTIFQSLAVKLDGPPLPNGGTVGVAVNEAELCDPIVMMERGLSPQQNWRQM